MIEDVDGHERGLQVSGGAYDMVSGEDISIQKERWVFEDARSSFYGPC